MCRDYGEGVVPAKVSPSAVIILGPQIAHGEWPIRQPQCQHRLQTGLETFMYIQSNFLLLQEPVGANSCSRPCVHTRFVHDTGKGVSGRVVGASDLSAFTVGLLACWRSELRRFSPPGHD